MCANASAVFTSIARSRTSFSPAARKTIKLVLEVQGQHGLAPYPGAPLFRMPSGKPFTSDQLASIFAMYRQAAEG